MILSLRRRHRFTFLGLTAFLPAVFVLGIASRDPVPAVDSLPASLAYQGPQASAALWTREDLWERGALRTRLLTNPAQSTALVEIVSGETVLRPDMLLYWAPGVRAIEDSLPDDAVLLGVWIQSPPRAIVLPPAATVRQGRLILYSLADQEIVNFSKPFVAK